MVDNTITSQNKKHIIDWSIIDPFLGTMSDREIGRKFNISNGNIITNRRKELNVPGYRKSHRDSIAEKIDPLLETMRDCDIAKKYGISEYRVSQRRKELRIPKPKIPHTSKAIKVDEIDWTKIDPLLGTIGDKDIADKYNITRYAVMKRRDALCIPTFKQTSRNELWKNVDPFLGTMKDIEISMRFGIDINTIHKRRNMLNIKSTKKSIDWTEIDSFLGNIPDLAVARAFSISPVTVGRRRNKLNIHNPFKMDPFIGKLTDSEIEILHSLLGTMPDAEIAKMFNCQTSTIGNYRLRKLNIMSFLKSHVLENSNVIMSLYGRVPVSKLSKKYKISTTALRSQAKKNGVHNSDNPYSKRYEWDTVDPLLGKMPDKELSEKTNISYGSIAMRRRSLGIKPFNDRSINWEEITPLLGTTPDMDIAERYGISSTAVGMKRRILGIPPYVKSYERNFKIDWETIEPYLGTMTDQAVAEKFNISMSSVWAKRTLLEIPAFILPIDWDKEIKYFPENNIMELSHKYDISPETIQRVARLYGIKYNEYGEYYVRLEEY